MEVIKHCLYILIGIFTCISGLYGIYMALVSLAGLWKARPLHPSPEGAMRRFAVLIPARNEENVIEKPVKTLLKQNYPTELYSIIVLPNNCDDNTEAVAREAGAQIMKPTCPVRCKGDVLQNILERLHTEGHYDAYVVFDADNLVHPDFLKEMNRALSGPYEIAQGYREVSNPTASISAGFGAVYYWMDNYFIAQSRWNLGASALLNGTGFGFTDAYLERTGGWNTVTITEDIEYSGRAAINGARVAWVPKAVTYDEQPVTVKATFKQRLRWTVGMYQCIGALLLPIFRAGRSSNTSKFTLADIALFYLFPVFGMMGFWAMLLMLICDILSLQTASWTPLVWHLLCFTVGSYIPVVFLGIAVTLRAGKTLKEGRKGIFGFWFFTMAWAIIAMKALFKKNQNWDPIRHGYSDTREVEKKLQKTEILH